MKKAFWKRMKPINHMSLLSRQVIIKSTKQEFLRTQQSLYIDEKVVK